MVDAQIEMNKARRLLSSLGLVLLMTVAACEPAPSPQQTQTAMTVTKEPFGTTGDGEAVFTRIYRADKIWKGERVDEAPDLQCAFADGFRVSWQTALLGVPEPLFETNDYPWSGDHCSNDVAETAGVFLCNKRLVIGVAPGLEDIAPTVCSLFGAPPPAGAEGRVLPLLLETPATGR